MKKLKIMIRFRVFPILFIVFFLGVSSGIAMHKFDAPPVPQLRSLKKAIFPTKKIKHTKADDDSLSVMKYSHGYPLYSDRAYIDTVGPQELDGLTLIQIKRHFKSKVRIETKKSMTVYRLITATMESRLFDGYGETDIKVNVKGHGCTHYNVVKRSFPPGIIDLYPGGPNAASPILVSLPETEFQSMIIENIY